MSYNTFLNEPLQFTTTKPVKLALQPFRDYNIPRASIRIGMKRSGKGVAMDKEVYKFWSKYFTCIWLHAAGGHENLYPIVNKGCHDKYSNIKRILQVFLDNNASRLTKDFIIKNVKIDQKTFEILLGSMQVSELIEFVDPDVVILKRGRSMANNQELHCNCSGTINSIWMHPEYIRIDQKSKDWFNGFYFKSYDEYYEAYMNLLVHEYLPPLFFEEKDYYKRAIKKPKSMLEKIKPVLKTMDFVPPTTPTKIEPFRNKMREIILMGREEHRLILNSTAVFPETHQGKLDKYHTAAEVINYIPELVQTDFQKLKLDKPRSMWSDKEKAHWKIALFLGEVRELAPSSQLSPDPESAVSKRALYGFMPKSRHNQTWVFMDLQSSADMFKGVKQQNDIFIIKRSTERILGEEFGWFYHLIDKLRNKRIEGRGFNENYVPKMFLDKLDKYLPKVDQLPDNKGYVIFPDDEFKLVSFEMQRWHHKTESDNFQEDTGLQWTITVPTEDDKTLKSGKKNARTDRKFSKKITDDDWVVMDSMKSKGKKWPEIIADMRKKDKDNGIEVDRFEAADPIKNISNKYNTWKKSQGMN